MMKLICFISLFCGVFVLAAEEKAGEPTQTAQPQLIWEIGEPAKAAAMAFWDEQVAEYSELSGKVKKIKQVGEAKSVDLLSTASLKTEAEILWFLSLTERGRKLLPFFLRWQMLGQIKVESQRSEKAREVRKRFDREFDRVLPVVYDAYGKKLYVDFSQNLAILLAEFIFEAQRAVNNNLVPDRGVAAAVERTLMITHHGCRAQENFVDELAKTLASYPDILRSEEYKLQTRYPMTEGVFVGFFKKAHDYKEEEIRSYLQARPWTSLD